VLLPWAFPKHQSTLPLIAFTIKPKQEKTGTVVVVQNNMLSYKSIFGMGLPLKGIKNSACHFAYPLEEQAAGAT